VQPVRSDPPELRVEPSLVTNAALSWLTFAGRAGFAFVATLLVARVLGPSGRGEVTYVVNIAALAALFLSAGTSAALVEMRVNHQWSDNRLHAAALGASLVTGLAFAVVAVVASLFVGGAQRTTLLVAAIVAVPLVAMANLNQSASLADRLRLVAWTALVGFGLYAFLTALTAVLGSMTVRNNLAFWVFTSILPVVMMIWPGRLITKRPPTLVADTRRLLVSSLRMNAAAIAVLAIWRADIVVVEFRRGFEELGLYSVAVGVAEIVVALSIGVRAAVLPHHSLSDAVRTADVLCTATRVSLPIVALLAMLVASVGPSGIELIFGEEYRSSYTALVLLLPGVVLLVLHYPLFDFVISRGGLRTLTVMGILGIGLNVGLNVILLDHFSFVAASVVSSISYLFVFAWCLVAFLRATNRSAGEVLLLRRSDVAGIKRRALMAIGKQSAS
jgi:O-antigen/teichoic acid export membrane protein